MVRSPLVKKISGHVSKILGTVTRNTAKGQPWIGLAISGGVDSMALAAVCSELQRINPTFRGAFKGFIVDHGVRDGSDEEASKVATELERLKIPAKVLKLAWATQDPKSLSNFETMARKLRYRALGSACWDEQIQSLLVAHHADDQAETVLSRIVTGYTGTGLQGMKMTSRIPECEGIYGADSSGEGEFGSPDTKTPLMEQRHSAKIFVENGGVTLYRPLLSLPKQDLVTLCEDNAVQWFEDQTNKDKTLTQRNTIRHLIRQEGVMPKAFERERLLAMADRMQNSSSRIEAKARGLFDTIPIGLDTQTGKAIVELPSNSFKMASFSTEDAYHIRAALLRRILLLVSPMADVAIQDLDQAMDFMFAAADALGLVLKPTKLQIAGVDIERREFTNGQRCGHRLFFTRAIPTRHEVDRCVRVPSSEPGWTPWILWDSRYWIRIMIPWESPTDLEYSIRFLTPELLGECRPHMARGGVFEEMLRRGRDYNTVPHPEKWTLPVVVTETLDESRIAGFPSLGQLYRKWIPGRDESPPESLPLLGGLYGRSMTGHERSAPNVLNIETRYKHVDLKVTANHAVVLGTDRKDRRVDINDLNWQEAHKKVFRKKEELEKRARKRAKKRGTKRCDSYDGSRDRVADAVAMGAFTGADDDDGF